MTEETTTTEETTRTTMSVVIHYMDGEATTVTVPPENIETFMKTLEEGTTYMDTNANSGIFVPTENIRYAHIVQTPLDATTETVTTTTEGAVEEQIEALETT